MINYLQPGKKIDIVPSQDYQSGDIVLEGNLFGIAVSNMTSGIKGAIQVYGGFLLPKATGVNFIQGDVLFYNITNGNFTKTPTDRPAAICIQSAASSATAAKVLIIPQLVNYVPLPSSSSVETIDTTTGAVSLAVQTTLFDTTTAGGAGTYTLADGVEGQLKRLIMADDGGDAVITPANFANGTTITLDANYEYQELLFLAGTWWALAGNSIIT